MPWLIMNHQEKGEGIIRLWIQFILCRRYYCPTLHWGTSWKSLCEWFDWYSSYSKLHSSDEHSKMTPRLELKNTCGLERSGKVICKRKSLLKALGTGYHCITLNADSSCLGPPIIIHHTVSWSKQTLNPEISQAFSVRCEFSCHGTSGLSGHCQFQDLAFLHGWKIMSGCKFISNEWQRLINLTEKKSRTLDLASPG